MFISDTSIKRPVFATVLMLALVTLGAVSYRRLAIEMMPDVEIPVLSIITAYPGAAPETVEREVTKRIEEAVNPITGVRHVTSTSREGLSSVIVEFNLEVKINEASQEARAKINAVRNELPETMKEPVIQKFDFAAMPIVSLAVRSDLLTPRDLTTLADRKIKRRLENIPGVAKAKLVGSSNREVSVEIDPARLDALGMGINEVVAGLQSENVNTPLGRLNYGTSELPLRVSGKPSDVGQYARMVIGLRGDEPITLGDVATVVDGVEEQRSLALINGVPAVAIDIMKQSKANTVQVVDTVKKTIADLKREIPAGVEIDLVRDSSTMIRESVADVQTTIILGGILTVLIVFCFLNSWRSTVITGLTLPISVISSFIIMNFAGMTINTMTLMALSLAIGLLIDDAIVVRENIVRHLEHGEDHFLAARNGTSEIGLAVLATSMSIMAVFIPVAFMKGVVGRFFYQFGLTVAFAVLVSLFVSFTLDPMLSSRWHDPDIERAGRRNLVQRGLDRFNAWFDRTADAYKLAIGWALDHRKTVFALASLAFLAGIGLFVTLPTEFMTSFDHGEFVIKLKTAPGASIVETRNRLEEVLKALGEFPEVKHTYASIAAGDADTVRDASIFVKLKEKRERKRSQAELITAARARLERIPGLLLSLQDDPDSWEKPLQIYIRGDEIPKLKQYSAELKRALYTVPGIVDLEASMELDLPEYRILVDRERAATSGLGTGAVAGTVGVLVGGQAVSTYEDDAGEAVDVRLRLPESLRRDIGQVGNLRLASPGPNGVTLTPLADLVRFERTTSSSEINRRDLARQVVISANLDNLPLGTATQKALEVADRLHFDPGYKVLMAGDTEIMMESFGYMAEALFLAIVFVYLILAAQFESFIDPLAIMLSLPLSIVGMAGMLKLTGDTVSIISLIGLILLMGLVTKNAILLVDYAKVMRRKGMDRRTALITAGRTRLRPIMMTTAAMIFGMLPLALAIGQGAEMRAPMARAVIGGLITSTMLTLLVVPVVYSLLDDLAAWLHRRWTAGEARPAAAALVALVVVAGPFLAAPATAEVPPVEVPAAPAAQPAPPGAGSQAPEVLVLTLEDALTLADRNNLDIQKAVEYQRWVHAKYVEERAGALPTLRLSLSGAKQQDKSQQDFLSGADTAGFEAFFTAERNASDAEVSLSQALFTWGQVGAAIRGAKYGIDGAEDSLRYTRQTARRDVSAAVYDVLLAKQLATIAQDTVVQKEKHLDEARRKNAVGTATDYDVLAAEVALANARPEAIRAANLVSTSRERLRFLLAETRRDVDVTGSLEANVEAYPDYAEATVAALANRADLAALIRRRQVAEELVKIRGADDRPRLDLQASYALQRYTLAGYTSSGPVWNAGLYLSYPVFDGLATRGRVAQAKSDVASVAIDETNLRDAITLAVRVAVDAVREAGAIVHALSGTVSQAERLLFMAEKGYELGVKTNLDVDDAQLNLRAARGSLARAQRDYLVAKVNLEWVKGTLDAPVTQ
jgi:hydrophobic/amphiphilic exporter-1 (mainly G- bacteria), HAE1 family